MKDFDPPGWDTISSQVYSWKMENWVIFNGIEGQTKIQISAKPGDRALGTLLPEVQLDQTFTSVLKYKINGCKFVCYSYR